MTARFADTWFFLALLDEHDQHHRRVADYAGSSADLIVTTRWVLAETANGRQWQSFCRAWKMIQT